MGSPSVLEQLKLLCLVGSPEGAPAQVRLAEQLLESGKAMQIIRANRFIQEAGFCPLLISYSNDGTGLKSKRPLDYKNASGAKERRVGKKFTEVLVQHLFLRYIDAGGEAHSMAIVREPLPLQYGKTGDAIFACSKDLCILGRDKGFQGIVVQHYCFDGALQSFLVRRFKQLHAQRALERRADEREASLDSRQLVLTEWVVSTQCVAHACHNSLKWGLAEVFGKDTAHLAQLWEVFAAVKENSGLLHDALFSWVLSKVDFTAGELLPSAELGKTIWSALGLPADLLDKFACEWHLTWVDDKLLVHDFFKNDPDIYQQISDAILAILCIGGFTESRWLTIGRSCRSLCLALMVGLKSLVQVALGDSAGNWYLSHFHRLFEGTNQDFCLVAALSAWVSDSVLELILEDSRGAKEGEAWRAAAQEEMSWMLSWPTEIWAHLAYRGLTGQASPKVMEEHVIKASLVAVAFMDSQIFQPISQYPWCLLQGNVRDNLEALRAEPDHYEATTWKIQKLVQENHSMHELLEAMRVLAEVNWSTQVTEQLHASVTLVHRHHPDYFLEHILLRAGLLSLQKLAPSMSHHQRVVAKLEAQLDKLDHLRSGGVTGRHMYFKRLCELYKAKYEAMGRTVPIATFRTINRLHGRRWHALDAQEKAYWEELAQDHMEQKKAETEDTKTQIIAMLDVAKNQNMEKNYWGQVPALAPLMLSTCPLADSDVVLWENILKGLAKRPDSVKQCRQAALRAPMPLTPEEQGALEEMPIDLPGANDPGKPLWLTYITQLRNHIKPCSLRFTMPDGLTETVFVVFLKRSPMELHAVLLQPATASVEEENSYGLPGSDELFQNDWTHVFDMDVSKDITWTRYAGLEVGAVEVLQQCFYWGRLQIVSNYPWTSLQEVVNSAEASAWPRRAERGEGSGGNRHQHHSPAWNKALLKAHPGLSAFHEASRQGSVASSSAGKAGGSEDEEDEDPALDEDELFQAASDLYERHRPEKQGFTAHVEKHFKAVMRGGLDAWQGQVVRSSPARAWCLEQGLQQTQKIPTVLGIDEGRVLASAWAHRMDFMYQASVSGNMATDAQAARTMEAYGALEPADFVQLMDTAKGQVLQLGNKIRGLLCRSIAGPTDTAGPSSSTG